MTENERAKIQCDSFARIQDSLRQMNRWKDHLYSSMAIGSIAGTREALREVNKIAEIFLRESEIHRAAEQKAAA